MFTEITKEDVLNALENGKVTAFVDGGPEELELSDMIDVLRNNIDDIFANQVDLHNIEELLF